MLSPINIAPIQTDTTNISRFIALRGEAIRQGGSVIRWGAQTLLVERSPPADERMSSADGWRCRQTV
jgi:hypothetical protein